MFQPINSNILVEPLLGPDKTAGFAIDDEGVRRRVIGIKDVLGKVV